jgi:hypothetical protein
VSNRAPVLTEDTAGAGAPLEPGSLTASATPGYWKINALGLLISLSNLLDVLLTAPATGNFLQYNGTKWVNNSVLTSGRVTYATTNGVLADSANHTWNNASGYLGVGNGVAAYPLDVYKTTGIVQSRTRTDDTTKYAQTLIQAGTSGIALAAFGTAWPASGVYGPGTAAFQSAAANGIFIVNESGEVHIVTHGFAAANKRFTFGSSANTSLEPLWIPGAGSNPTTTLGEGGAGNLLTNAYNDGTWKRIATVSTPVGMFLNPNGAALADVAWYKSTAGAAGSAITWTRLMEVVGATGELELDGSLVLPKTSGLGIKVDPAAPTFGWRTLTSAIDPKATGSGSPARTLYRGTIYGYAFGVGDLADFDGFHIPHDYLPGSDIFVNVHWSHNGTAISGTAVFEVTMTYAKGHNQANFPAEVTQTITVATPNIATVPQYRHRVDEVQASQAGGSATLHNTTDLEVDGLMFGYVKLVTLPTITGGDLFIHTVDIHYQSTNMATKQKSPNFYT